MNNLKLYTLKHYLIIYLEHLQHKNFNYQDIYLQQYLINIIMI